MNKYRYSNTNVFIEEQGDCTVKLLQSDKLYVLSGFQYTGHTVHSITNCSYFATNYVIGRNQGDMYNATCDQSQAEGYSLVIMNDNSYHIGKMESWDYTENVDAGFLVGAVLIQDKKDVALISGAAKTSVSLTTKQPQTMIGYCDGKWLQIVCDGRSTDNAGLTSKALRKFIRTKYPNIELLVQVDGGGSTEMIIDNEIVNVPSDGKERKMWNGFAFIEPDKKEEPEEEETETQTAILSFKMPDKTTDILSGISTKEGVISHTANLANDFMGLNNVANVYLKAPYDCVVRAIATCDNTVFFESKGKVKTPAGTYNRCWFMAAHMLDDDLSDLGIVVGKEFKQGEICYREGKKAAKGVTISGPHMHVEMGTGKFNGTTVPYYNSGQKFTYTYNGNTYTATLYKPYTDGEECSVYNMMYLDNLDTSKVNILKVYDKWQFVEDEEKEKTELELLKEENNNLKIQVSDLNKEVETLIENNKALNDSITLLKEEMSDKKEKVEEAISILEGTLDD